MRERGAAPDEAGAARRSSIRGAEPAIALVHVGVARLVGRDERLELIAGQHLLDLRAALDIGLELVACATFFTRSV